MSYEQKKWLASRASLKIAKERRQTHPMKNHQLINQDFVKKMLETPFWQPTLDVDTQYCRQHDDHGGKPKGGLMVIFDRMGDAYISTDNHPWLRFRTVGGGGQSERTRMALMVLAEAIRLDNKDRPQSSHPSA